MKQIIGAIFLLAGLAACGDNNVGDRTYNMPTVNDSLAPTNGVTTINDTTPTTNNNTYNPDSPAGRGTTYDTMPNRNTQQP